MSDERVERIGEALRVVLSDPAWLKRAVIGAGIMLIPYVGMIWLMGYCLLYMLQVAEHHRDGLPEWKHAEAQIRAGLFPFLVGIVYSIPLAIILSAFAVVGVAAGIILLASSEAVLWAIVVFAALFLVTMLVSLAWGAVLYPTYVHVTIKGDFASGFQFGEIWRRVKRASSAYWTAYVRTLALGLLSATASMLIMGALVGAVAFIGWQVMSEETFAMLGGLLIYPVQLAATVLAGLISVPVMFATYRIWAGYARAAYWTETGEAELVPEAKPTPSEA